jgi:hypothetical protein
MAVVELGRDGNLGCQLDQPGPDADRVVRRAVGRRRGELRWGLLRMGVLLGASAREDRHTDGKCCGRANTKKMPSIEDHAPSRLERLRPKCDIPPFKSTKSIEAPERFFATARCEQ